VAQNIKVKVKAKPDVKLLEVLSDFDVDGKDDKSQAVINVDDVYSEERRKVLVKIELPALEKMPPRPFKFADIEVDFFDVQAKEPRQEKAKATVEYAKEAEAQTEPSPLVKEELARIEAAKAQEEARKFADQGQFDLAQKVIQDRVFRNPKIEVIWDAVVRRIGGGPAGVTHLELASTRRPDGEYHFEGTDETRTLEVGGIFVFIGFAPNVQLVEGHVEHDDAGYFTTDWRMETSMPGLFAVGDVRSQLVRQITTAVGDATTAAMAVERYLTEVKEDSSVAGANA